MVSDFRKSTIGGRPRYRSRRSPSVARQRPCGGYNYTYTYKASSGQAVAVPYVAGKARTRTRRAKTVWVDSVRWPLIQLRFRGVRDEQTIPRWRKRTWTEPHAKSEEQLRWRWWLMKRKTRQWRSTLCARVIADCWGSTFKLLTLFFF